MQEREVGIIPEEVHMGKKMSLRRYLRRGYTTEVFKRVLEMAVISDNKQWRNR